MLLFAIGGWGGAINASFGMNAVIHNTSWVPGHFHTTVGSASALTFMGACVLAACRACWRRRLELAPMATRAAVALVSRHAALLDSDAPHGRDGHAPAESSILATAIIRRPSSWQRAHQSVGDWRDACCSPARCSSCW